MIAAPIIRTVRIAPIEPGFFANMIINHQDGLMKA